MEFKNLIKSVAAGILLIPVTSFSQIEPETPTSGGGYMIGDHVEIGVNWGGHEGTWTHPVLAPNERGGWTANVRHGFISNPAMDGWTNYDGDFFSPGSPENGFGLEIGGVSYSNNAVNADWASPDPTQEEIDGDLISWEVDGDCIEVYWQGMILGIQVDVRYKLVTTELYYTTQVQLTNTTAADVADMYYYRNFDPDNNQTIGWGFTTTNTIVAQPDVDCEIALVSAEQFNTWDNYIGLGAIGEGFRVTHGGFTNRDASDIWNGVAPFTQTEGAVTVSDIAISLGYYIDNLPAGEDTTFQFAVIMSEDDVDAAISSLYYFSYEGAGGVIDECNPVVDTVQICAGTPTIVSVDGPASADYTWDWTPAVDIAPTVGPTVSVYPTVTTTYTVTGTPTVGCLDTPIEKQIVVEVIPSPIIDVVDPGPQCGEFDLTTLVITDLAAVPGSFTEFYDVAPDSADQVVGIYPGPLMYEGDSIWLLMGEPVNGCFDSLLLDINFDGSADAGPDSSGVFCNVAGTIVTMDTYIPAADPGGTWTDVSVVPAGAAFNAGTSDLNADGLAAGTYVFMYVAYGLPPCDNDTAYITIDISQEVFAGADNTDQTCNAAGDMVDLNTLLDPGADAGGVWAEVTSTGALNPATGIINAAGVTPGDIICTYTVAGTAPCPDDVATFTVTVNGAPPVVALPSNPGGNIEVCEGTVITLAAGGVGPGGTIVWDGGVTDGVSFTQPVGTETYNVVGTDVNGCSATDNVTVTVFPTPIITLTADTTEGCTPFEVVFTGTSVPDAVNCTWNLGNGDMPTSCGIVGTTYEVEGVYDISLTIEDVNGCTNSITYDDYITVATTPIASFTFNPTQILTDDPVATFDNSSLFATEYLWNFDDGTGPSTETNPTHEFPPVGYKEYTVTLTASNYLGCYDETSKVVRIDEWIIFYIPNVFTPDGDEYNETFKPVFYSGVEPYDYHMTIFNRYGEVIWESYNYGVGWDGTYGDRGLIQDGTYVWQIDFKEKSSDKRHKHHGHVTILK